MKPVKGGLGDAEASAVVRLYSAHIEVVEHPEWSIRIRNRGYGRLALTLSAGVCGGRLRELESVLCRGLFIV